MFGVWLGARWLRRIHQALAYWYRGLSRRWQKAFSYRVSSLCYFPRFDRRYFYVKDFISKRVGELFGNDMILLDSGYNKKYMLYCFYFKYRYVPSNYEVKVSHDWRESFSLTIFDDSQWEGDIEEEYISHFFFSNDGPEFMNPYMNLLFIDVGLMKLKKALDNDDVIFDKMPQGNNLFTIYREGNLFTIYNRYKGKCRKTARLDTHPTFVKGGEFKSKFRGPFREYLLLRWRVFAYTEQDLKLDLTDNDEIYTVLVDIPVEDTSTGEKMSKTFTVMRGFNTHFYYSNGEALLELERYRKIRNAGEKLLSDLGVVLPYMELTGDTDFYESENIRVYAKTRQGTYFKEISLDSELEKDKHILSLLADMFQIIDNRGVKIW